MLSKILPIGMASSVAMAALGPARKVLLSGESASSLCMHLTARAVCAGKRVVFICGDNSFDPYAVAGAAKAAGVSPEEALRSVLIARAFTAYQLSELVCRLEPGSPDDFVVISGPCSTLFDEDVQIVDAARLFYRMLWRIVELASGGMTLLLTQGGGVAAARRAYFLADLCRASDVVMRLSGRHSFTLEHHSRAFRLLSAER